MFGWRRKNDGFVWREYVRTTILVRRGQRKQKVEDIRDAAVGGIKHAGRQGVALGIAGASAAGRGIATGAVAAAYAIYDFLTVATAATALWIVDRWAGLSPALVDGAGRLTELVRQPAVSTPLLLAAAIGALSAAARWSTNGFDTNAMLAAVISGCALLLAAIPVIADFAPAGLLSRLSRAAGGVRLPGTGNPGLGSALGLGAMLMAAAAGLSWLVPALTSGGAGVPATSATTATPALTAVSGRIEGKGVAIAGDQLRVGGTLVRLYGVEAPERGQNCTGPGGKTAPCATLAKTALQKIAGGKRVTCEIASRAAAEASATCQVNGADIAGQLVRGGQVFATTGLFATYASAEREARAANAGLWRAGDRVRPAEFRTKAWADAKQSAPDGCPIKGVVAGDDKTYLVPWAANYDKTKIRPARGERWFCTEDEARSAGWRPEAS